MMYHWTITAFFYFHFLLFSSKHSKSQFLYLWALAVLSLLLGEPEMRLVWHSYENGACLLQSSSLPLHPLQPFSLVYKIHRLKMVLFSSLESNFPTLNNTCLCMYVCTYNTYINKHVLWPCQPARFLNPGEALLRGSGWTVSCYCTEEGGMIQGCLLDSFQDALAVWLMYTQRLKITKNVTLLEARILSCTDTSRNIGQKGDEAVALSPLFFSSQFLPSLQIDNLFTHWVLKELTGNNIRVVVV